MRVLLLLAGVAGPLIYVAFALAGQWLAPGYDPAVRMISELGMADMPSAAVFNIGLIAAGVLTVLAALGLSFEAARRGAPVSGVLAGLAVAIFGASIVVGGLFPLPDERHLAWGAGFAVQIAPLLTLVALRKAQGLAALKVFLAAAFVAVNGLLAVLFGIGDLVDGTNLGLWQRAYGLAMFPWISVTALVLLTTPAARSGELGATVRTFAPR
jgi:hypothetical membrane protein